MIAGSRVLAIIPARGGSKGLPRKNVMPLAGRPLLSWTIDAARASKYVDRVVLSTDDDEIADVGRAFGADVPFRRPSSLASDTATSLEVIEHAVAELPGYDVVVLLQPTSPLRAPADIDACLELCSGRDAPVVSVVESDKRPEWMYSIESSGRVKPLVAGPAPSRRQDGPTAYVLNGAVYVARTATLLRERTFVTNETIGWVMPKARSIDIDDQLDFALAELLAQETTSPAPPM